MTSPLTLHTQEFLHKKTYQKDNLHFGKSMKADDSEDYMKAIEE